VDLQKLWSCVQWLTKSLKEQYPRPFLVTPAGFVFARQPCGSAQGPLPRRRRSPECGSPEVRHAGGVLAVDWSP